MKYLKDTVYDQIKTKIIECEYPPDSILTEARLMEDTGVSRTPIREAINRLAHENLVMVIPKRAFWSKESPFGISFRYLKRAKSSSRS
ncbi:MAG: GntR family transcriptional regulator [Christensenellales bacterium]